MGEKNHSFFFTTFWKTVRSRPWVRSRVDSKALYHTHTHTYILKALAFMNTFVKEFAQSFTLIVDIFSVHFHFNVFSLRVYFRFTAQIFFHTIDRKGCFANSYIPVEIGWKEITTSSSYVRHREFFHGIFERTRASEIIRISFTELYVPFIPRESC